MNAVRFAILSLILLSMSSAFASAKSGKENCQAQAGGTIAKDKRQLAAEALRVVEGAAKPAPKTQQPSSKAISEKGS